MNIIFAILVSILPLQPDVQPPAIKGARISLVPKPQAILNITIENRRATPLVWWQIRLDVRSPGGRTTMIHTGSGSIPSGGKRMVAVQLANPQEVATAALIAVEHEDGFHEGTAEAVQAWRRNREERAQDLSYWLRVLGMMPRISEPDLRRYLSNHLGERVGEAPDDPSGFRNKLHNVLLQHPTGPDVWQALDRLRLEAQAALTWNTREPAAGSRGGVVDAITSAVISAQEQVETTTYDVAIENLRSVPIEALGFETFDPATNRPKGGQTSDFWQGSVLMIQPREIRRSSFFSDVNPLAPPAVKLSFVLFEDLSFEGSETAVDELLRRRESYADDYAHAIAAVKEIAARAPADVEAFLVAKRAERARQLLSAGRRDSPILLDGLIREAKSAPERFLAGAQARAQHLERQRQRLLRHKTPAAK